MMADFVVGINASKCLQNYIKALTIVHVWLKIIINRQTQMSAARCAVKTLLVIL